MSSEPTESDISLRPKTAKTEETAPKYEEMLVKHLLLNEWSMWCLLNVSNSSSKKVSAQNAQVYDFNTVEDFWALYNDLKKPSETVNVNTKSNIIFLRKGVKPEWEDEQNKAGGEWVVDFNAKERKTGALDKAWDNTLMAAIGGSFTYSDQIAAIWLSIRPKGDKLSMWTFSSEPEVAETLGNEWMEILKTRADINDASSSFTAHADSVDCHYRKVPTEIKPRFYVGKKRK